MTIEFKNPADNQKTLLANSNLATIKETRDFIKREGLVLSGGKKVADVEPSKYDYEVTKEGKKVTVKSFGLGVVSTYDI